MNCSEFRRRFRLYVESRDPSLAERIKLQQHVQECGERKCQRRWQAEELLSERIPEWRDAIPSVSLSERVMSELRGPLVRRSEIDRGVGIARTSAIAGSQPIDTPGSHGVTHSVQALALWDSEASDRSTGIEEGNDAQQSSAGLLAPSHVPGRLHQPGRLHRHWTALSASVLALLIALPFLLIGSRNSFMTTAATIPSSAVKPQVFPDSPIGSPKLAPDAGVPRRESKGVATHEMTPTEDAAEITVSVSPAGLSRSDDAEAGRSAVWRALLGEQLAPWSHEIETALEALLEQLTHPPESSHREYRSSPMEAMTV